MRLLLSVVALVFANYFSFGQDNATTKKAKDDILKLHSDWNEARIKKDMDGLERVFAKEYVFIHGNGFLDDRETAMIDQINTDSIQPLAIPDPNEITVYDDIAVTKRLIKNPQGASFNTILYVKRNGRWQIALHQSTPFQPERNYTKLPSNELQKYTGKYVWKGQTALVTKENDTLRITIPTFPRRVLLPTADNLFYNKTGTEYKFVKNVAGSVTQLILKTEDGLETQWKKIN